MSFNHRLLALEVFLSERISQDPLEKFFGCQRQRGRVNENPTVTEQKHSKASSD